jgi:hypothetical protein
MIKYFYNSMYAIHDNIKDSIKCDKICLSEELNRSVQINENFWRIR